MDTQLISAMKSNLDSCRLTLRDGTGINFKRRGIGKPIVFLPGWSMTCGFFHHQLVGLSGEFDVITLDPRSQGESDKTGRNNFRQRGQDLAEIIDALDLEPVIVVAWSLGVNDLYSYIDQFGDDHLAGAIFVDQGPKAIKTRKDDWVFADIIGLAGFFNGFKENPDEFLESFIRQCFEKGLDDETLQWMVSEARKTPQEIALLLLADGWFSDYESVLTRIEKPLAHFVTAASVESATTYLNRVLDEPILYTFASHFMFWEESTRFNECVRTFIGRC